MKAMESSGFSQGWLSNAKKLRVVPNPQITIDVLGFLGSVLQKGKLLQLMTPLNEPA
ncbi:hypothetical protein [Thermogutta sp.]|uniref:hypothetical protein n=1 Tax=Thermogutta sp. TaxID=1962930 RepID=UPI0025CC3DAA|nr:hypothetical protein [Thermogutta sp.]